MEFLKSLAGRIISGAVALAVVAGGISWWSMEPASRHQLAAGVGCVAGWLGLVLLLPWATFFLIGWVARRRSNAAGAVLVLAYVAIEAGLLAWLFDFALHGVAVWVFFSAGVLASGVYNLFTCDWIAEKVE